MDPDFDGALAACLRRIPRGHVASCGAVARALGDVRAARAVYEWLSLHPGIPGAHRVVRADGKPVVAHGIDYLRREGIRALRGIVPRKAFANRLPPTPLLEGLREEQMRMSRGVVQDDAATEVDQVGGVDIAYANGTMYAAAVCLRLRDLLPLDVVRVTMRARFPYIPGYLGYRELPGIEAAVSRLSSRPDVLMIDGHGRLHPARFGAACHAGVRLNVPTIGVAKHLLMGRPSRQDESQDAVPIELDRRTEGFAWIPPNRIRPIFVSVGHRISLRRALSVVRRATVHGYPEPIRLADRMSKEMKQREKREKGAAR